MMRHASAPRPRARARPGRALPGGSAGWLQQDPGLELPGDCQDQGPWIGDVFISRAGEWGAGRRGSALLFVFEQR